MKNWKYINGAEGVKIGNYGVSLDSAGARQVREMAAKLWHSGMHNSRDIAMAIAFEIAKTSKAMQENKADVVSNIQDIIDRWIKEVKTGNDTPAEYAKQPPKVVGGNKKCLNADYSRASDNDLKSWLRMAEQDLKDAKRGFEKASKDWKGAPANEYDREVGKYSTQINEANRVIRNLEEELRKRGVRNSLPEELEKDVKKKDKEKVGEVEELKKTGNESSTVSEYNSEIQRLTRKAEQLRRMGQGRSAMEVEKQIEKLGKELHELTKVGNDISGLGLKKGDKVKVKSGMWSGEKGKVTGIHVSAKDQTLEVEVKLDNGGYVVDDQKQFVKIGNSASDDKFAYVMREFDEGKLKTPDGKVVTDPAQAKAIAYSESKKTENGLARARNAIKK